MDTNPVTLIPSPIAQSASDFDNNADERIHIPESGAASYSPESRSLVDRSVIQTKKIFGPELRELILKQNFSDDIHYQVEGDLSLKGCTGLKALPEKLSVGGSLFLDGCTSLTALPEKLSVGGSLFLDGCTSLTALSGNLYVGDILSLSGCTALKVLPENLCVVRNLRLCGCTSLTALPENLSVRAVLDLRGCTGLMVLPENLSVGAYLNLARCTSLRALPKNFSVKEGSLNLCNCTGLTTLPENLYVGLDLNLTGCSSLTTLPENLHVGGNLNLMGCSNLTALPEHLFLGADLSLTDCSGLTVLPNWITLLGPRDWINSRNVYLENTGLSDALTDRLRTAEAPGVRFYFSRGAGQPEQRFSNPEQGVAFWRELASSDAEIPQLDLQHDQAVDLARFLGRLTTTVHYQNQATRPVLARRVMKVMSLLAGDEQVRGHALQRIHHALGSRDDRMIPTLDDLETLPLLITAETLVLERGDSSQLLALGQRMMGLDKVKKIARDHMKNLHWVDEVEVEMAFRIGVHEHLDLPGFTRRMPFRGCAYVSDQDINNAVRQIRSYCFGDNLDRYLAGWAPWQKIKRPETVTSFD